MPGPQPIPPSPFAALAQGLGSVGITPGNAAALGMASNPFTLPVAAAQIPLIQRALDWYNNNISTPSQVTGLGGAYSLPGVLNPNDNLLGSGHSALDYLFGWNPLLREDALNTLGAVKSGADIGAAIGRGVPVSQAISQEVQADQPAYNQAGPFEKLFAGVVDDPSNLLMVDAPETLAARAPLLADLFPARLASLGPRALLEGGDLLTKVPGVSRMFELHPTAAANALRDSTKTLADAASVNGVDPQVFADQIKGLTENPQQFTGPAKAILGRGDTYLTTPEGTGTAQEIHNLAASKLPALQQEAANWVAGLQQQTGQALSPYVQKALADKYFYTNLPDLVRQAKLSKLGQWKVEQGTLGKIVGKLNQGAREYDQSSGLGFIPDTIDNLAKSILGGYDPANFLADRADFGAAQQAGGTASTPVRAITGSAEAPGEIGSTSNDAITSGHQTLLSKYTPERVALGALEGALSGHTLPEAALNAGLEGLAQYLSGKGLEFNLGNRALNENTSRNVLLAQGFGNYLKGGEIASHFPLTEQPLSVLGRTIRSGSPDLAHFNQVRDASFATIDQAAGGTQLTDMLRQGWVGTPQQFEQEALARGLTPQQAWQATSAFTDLHSAGIKAGAQLVNKHLFAYDQPNKLMYAAREVTPFPQWAMQNYPYYLGQMAEKPAFAGLLANYELHSAKDVESTGAPNSTFGKVPIPLPGALGGGTLWANLLSPFSVTGQFGLPQSAEMNTQGSFLDKIAQLGEMTGMDPNPALEIFLEALGLVNQGEDFPDISPWSRTLGQAAQLATGRVQDPEFAWKGGPGSILGPLGYEVGGPIGGLAASLLQANGWRQWLNPEAANTELTPEYLIRKRITEMARQATGHEWWDTSDPGTARYRVAMASSDGPIWSQAARQTAGEQLLTSTMARLGMLEPRYMSPGETQIDLAHRVMWPLEAQNLIPISTLAYHFPNLYPYHFIDQPPQYADAVKNMGVAPSLAPMVAREYALLQSLPANQQTQYLAQNPILSYYLYGYGLEAGQMGEQQAGQKLQQQTQAQAQNTIYHQQTMQDYLANRNQQMVWDSAQQQGPRPDYSPVPALHFAR